MLPAYVVHCMEGRARLRHPALGEVAVRAVVSDHGLPLGLSNESGTLSSSVKCKALAADCEVRKL